MLSHHGNVLPAPSEVDDDHDVDAAPVVLWRVGRHGRSVTLSDGAPPLHDHGMDPNEPTGDRAIGGHAFRLRGGRVHGGWLVAGQSLAEPSHVEGVLFTGEIIAGPVLLLRDVPGHPRHRTQGVAPDRASPPAPAGVHRRRLARAADAAQRDRGGGGPGLALPREAQDYRDTLSGSGRESDRLRRLVEDLLWLARFDARTASAR